jgi:serine-type D-Ala-D-Ala carboxypeptidase/endopeptidase (penicillin-binding protein 4)
MTQRQPAASGSDRPSRRAILGSVLTMPMALSIVSAAPGKAQAGSRSTNPELNEKIRRIVTRPEFNGSWGVEFRFADSGKQICTWNSAQPLRVASSIKLFITATAFEKLGPDHRFRTRIYATGPIRHGVLHGDLVLVAGGDLLLGCRVQPDGSIAVPNPEHTYANGSDPVFEPLPGDPLQSFRQLAEQVRAKGVRRVTGKVIVDASLFRQTPEPAGGMPIVASPMMVNDNVVDVTITPAARAGRAAKIVQSPHTPYVRIVNQVRTIDAWDTGAAEPLRISEDVARPDGTRVVTFTGALPAGTPSRLFAYHLPDPARSAEFAFAKTLRDAGVHADPAPRQAERHNEGRGNSLLAELVGPPLSKQVWPMLKVSNNPLAATIPFLVGAIAGDEPENAKAAYERFRGELFAEAGLDPNPPGSEEAKYAAELFTTFMGHINGKPYIEPLVAALHRVRGPEGDDHPAGSHVFAKGGSGTWPADNGVEIHHALAGYLKPPGKETVSFTVLTEQFATPDPANQAELGNLMRIAMWDILTTVYDALI